MKKNNLDFDTQNKTMDLKMKDYNQQIINFNYDKNFRYEDFYVSKSNEHILKILDRWPKWEKIF